MHGALRETLALHDALYRDLRSDLMTGCTGAVADAMGRAARRSRSASGCRRASPVGPKCFGCHHAGEAPQGLSSARLIGVPLDAGLEGRAGFEADVFASFDLDRLPGPRVQRLTRFGFGDPEGPERGQGESALLFQSLHDSVD
jgi:hypothetical protein